jgi:mRNA-degrading endonuclease RelE of RelBE toxin-antitoxin system
MYDVVIKKKVNRFIDSLQNSEKIREKLKRLEDFKSGKRLGLDIERVKGMNKNRYRVRIGDVRYLFEVAKIKIFVDGADYRGRVYK